MSNNKYIIKNLAPWMIDELVSFSKFSKFDLIFLREQDEFYDEDIALLRKRGIRVLNRPFKAGLFLKKIFIVFFFLLRNIFKFSFSYNFVLGFKSIFLFLRLDLSEFSEESNLHAQFATQATIICLLIKQYYNFKPKYYFTFHAHDIYFNNRWFNLLLKNCDLSFSISQYNIKYVKNKFTISNKYVLSRLGVNRDIVADIKNKSNVFTMGTLSWFVEKKGIIFLLEAFLILKNREYNNIKLILAGDGPLKNKYINYIKDNSLESNIKYIGKIRAEEKDTFYKSIDSFVLPSIALKNDQDGIPVVLMEAVAYSLPIISTDVSGISEICVDEYNGYLLNEKNADNIADAIIKLMENKNIQRNFAINSKKISNQYDIDINSKSKLKKMDWM